MGLIGRLLMTIFGLVFLVVGMALSWQAVKKSLSELEVLTWRSVPCTVDSVRLETGDSGYTVAIAYHYSADGRSYTAAENAVQNSMDYGRALSTESKFSRRSDNSCRICRSDPSRSRISFSFPFEIFFILFSSIFVLVGAIIIVTAWSRQKVQAAGVSTALSDADAGHHNTGRTMKLSDDKGSKAIFYSSVRLLLYFILCLVGALGCWRIYTAPFLERIDAFHWQQVPCTIVRSAVTEHSDSEGGTTYSLDIVFRYQYEGRQYVSGRYALAGGEPSGYRRKRAIADTLPPGLVNECFVNPRSPAQSVLRRTGVPSIWSIIIVALTFGMIMLLRHELRRRICCYQLLDRTPQRNLILYSTSFPSLVSTAWAVAAFFWNVPFIALINDILVHPPLPQQAAEMEQFVHSVALHMLTGIAIILFGIGSLRKLFLPRIMLIFESYPLYLGEKNEVRWQLKGAAAGLSRLAFSFWGREEVKYVQGTSTVTDKSTFREYLIDETRHFGASNSGTTGWTVPAEQMHSFSSANNSIIWTLTVKGGSDQRDSIDESFECLVLPLRSMPRKRI